MELGGTSTREAQRKDHMKGITRMMTGLFNFFYFESILDFITMFALTQIITILFNCPETECNFLVLKGIEITGQLIKFNLTEDYKIIAKVN
ncbi:hypothetical protein TURU_138778 [Turdus rufiventris]|nr:hypothetical protein TURU_138778 [Turdus rufiventris]